MKKSALVAAATILLALTPAVAQAAQQAAPAPASEQVDGSRLNGNFIIPVVLVVAGVLALLAVTHTFPFRRHHGAPHSP